MEIGGILVMFVITVIIVTICIILLKKEIKTHISAYEKFKKEHDGIDFKSFTGTNGETIYILETGELFHYRMGNLLNSLNVLDVVDIDVQLNNKSINITKAIAGGLLAGDVGAILGGLSDSSKVSNGKIIMYSKNFSEEPLIIYFNNEKLVNNSLKPILSTIQVIKSNNE